MRLKRIQVKGFKSFAKETIIHFNEDITGIVGPNGSGKSNVVDAIRWVLGEQKTRELRLDKMGDVLFNGTKEKRPSPYARVSIIFDNDKGNLPNEYHEISISRTLYRTGESEYRLNDVLCRLKDVHALLMDTGVGSNTYAIIALGMVDDILADKENARRKMFEQAAGITKFKIRKKETLNRLKLTEQDLERVEDLVHEIEKNLKGLEKQAKKAEKFLKLKSKYKDLSLQLAHLESKHLKDSYKEIEHKVENEKSKYEAINASLHQAQAKLESQKSANLGDEAKVSENQKALSQLIGKIRSHESDKKLLIQRIEYSEKSFAKQQEELQNIDQRILDDQQKCKQLTLDLATETKILEQKVEQQQALKKEKDQIDASFTSIQSDRKQQFEQQQKLESDKFEWEKQMAILDSKLADIQQYEQRYQSEKAKLENFYNDNRAQLEQAKQEHGLLQKQYETGKNQEAKRQEAIKSLEDQIKALKEELSQLHRKVDAQVNEYELTKSWVENLEGFPESTQFLKKNKKHVFDAPFFSDIIACPDHLRIPLENYLEPYLNHFIVDEGSEALHAVDLLKQAQKGRASFIVNTFEDYQVPEIEEEGVYSALDQVEAEDKFKPLLEALLHHVFFIKEGVDIKYLVKSYPDFVFLKEDGSLVIQKNWVTGGSTGLFEGRKIGRKKKLESLSKEIKSLKSKIETRENRISEHQQAIKALEKEENQASIKGLEDQIQKQSTHIQKLELEAKNCQSNLQKLEEEYEKYGQEKSRHQATLKEGQSKLKAIKVQLNSLNEQLSKVESTYQDLNEQRAKTSEAYNEAHIVAIRQENRTKQVQNDLNYAEKNALEVKKRKQSLESNIQSLEKQIEMDQQKLIGLSQELEAFYEKKKLQESQLNTVEQKYFKAKSEIAEIEKDISNKQKQSQQQLEFIQQLREEFNQVKMQLMSISERLKVEFDLSINDIKADVETTADLDTLKAQVQKTKARISNFGEVNPLAVEAYQEMKARYDTIVKQRQDILDAEQELKKTIREIEVTATQKYLEAFEQVRTHFIDVFRTLFTEDDTADLIIEDEEDPLNSSIDIIAKPKGKRPKSLSQLSGGEKTLTATALLFALYLIKPAPFCIFDEVDAPLDDANIYKFNKIIKRFSEQSQFIIVTHNKSTMAEMDVIYGVYMNETGISSVSAVDFRDLEHQSLLVTK